MSDLKIRIDNNKAFYIILAIVIAFYSGSAVSTISSGFRNSIIFVAAASLVVSILRHRYYVSCSARTLFLFYFGLMILITLLATKYSIFYLRLYATIYVAYRISEKVDFKVFASAFVRVMAWVTGFSILCFFAINVLKLNLPSFSFANINGEVYRGFILFNYIQRLPGRNCAFFWEPGLFASAVTIALVFEMLYVGKISRLRVVVFVVGLLTANSASGYVLLLLLLVLASARLNPQKQSAKAILLVFQILFVIAAVVAFLNLDKILTAYGLAQNKQFSKLMTGTFVESQRARAIQDSLAMFLQNPLFGNGYSKIAQSMTYIGDTATSFYFMSIFGILGCGYSVFFVMGVLRQREVSIIARVVLIVILFGILNKEPHVDLLFTWLYGFYLLKHTEKRGLSVSQPYSPPDRSPRLI